MKKSSVSRTRRFKYFQILCYALERWTRTHSQILFGKKNWLGSRVHHNTELWTQLMGNRCNSSGIFSQDAPHRSSATKVQEFMFKMSDQPEEFKGRNIFMSMFNGISWGSEDNEQECESNANLVSIYARRFPPGRWSFLGPGSEKKWYSTHDSRPQGEWDRVAELMMIKFGESGHPVFRATSPLSRGTLKSKGGGKLSIHFCDDGRTIETVFRTIISVNQLSIYGAVSDFVTKTKLAKWELGDLYWQDNLTHCLTQQVCWRKHLFLWPMILRKKIYCKSTKNEWKGSHNKIVWLRFVLMQDSWRQLESDRTSWQRTLKSSHNLQNQWHVVSTLCQEMKNHLTRKVGIRGNTKIGPVLEVTTSYLQGQYGV